MNEEFKIITYAMLLSWFSCPDGLDHSKQGSQFRTVPTGTAEIYLIGRSTGIETPLFRTTQNTRYTGEYQTYRPENKNRPI